MIPAPNTTLDCGSHCWNLEPDLKLWWYDHTRRWGLSCSSSTGRFHSSIHVDLGEQAPAAWLLLAHNYRGAA
jgi:hypothetical protein